MSRERIPMGRAYASTHSGSAVTLQSMQSEACHAAQEAFYFDFDMVNAGYRIIADRIPDGDLNEYYPNIKTYASAGPEARQQLLQGVVDCLDAAGSPHGVKTADVKKMLTALANGGTVKGSLGGKIGWQHEAALGEYAFVAGIQKELEDWTGRLIVDDPTRIHDAFFYRAYEKVMEAKKDSEWTTEKIEARIQRKAVASYLQTVEHDRLMMVRAAVEAEELEPGTLKFDGLVSLVFVLCLEVVRLKCPFSVCCLFWPAARPQEERRDGHAGTGTGRRRARRRSRPHRTTARGQGLTPLRPQGQTDGVRARGRERYRSS